MIREPSNLIRQEYILNKHLKFYATHDKKKLSSLEFHQSFIRNYFYCGHTFLSATKSTPGKSRHV